MFFEISKLLNFYFFWFVNFLWLFCKIGKPPQMTIGECDVSNLVTICLSASHLKWEWFKQCFYDLSLKLSGNLKWKLFGHTLIIFLCHWQAAISNENVNQSLLFASSIQNGASSHIQRNRDILSNLFPTLRRKSCSIKIFQCLWQFGPCLKFRHWQKSLNKMMKQNMQIFPK